MSPNRTYIVSDPYVTKMAWSPLWWKSVGKSTSRSKSKTFWKQSWNKKNYAKLNRTPLRSKNQERVLGEFKQTVWNSKLPKKASKQREISKNRSNIMDRSKASVGSPLRWSSKTKSSKKGNYSVKRVGGGYVREAYVNTNEEEKFS